MAKPTISSQISLGAIIQIFVLVVTAFGFWFALKHQTETAASVAGSNTAQITLLETRVRVLETTSARDSEQLRTLQRDISEIKDGQREINRLLRQLMQRGSLIDD